jgi:hypothetical protein
MKPIPTALLLLVLLAGCAPPLPAPTVTPSSTATATIAPTATPAFPLPEGQIIFETSNGKKFSGMVHGQGETAIILANMTVGGQTQWDPFVEVVDKENFTTLTFNYLNATNTGAIQDIKVVFNFLKASGYKRFICIGASLGILACAGLAREPEIVGVVLISGLPVGGQFKDATYPKLCITGEDDRWAYDTRQTCKLAAEPKTMVVYPDNGNHGTNLFYSKDREAFLQTLIDFVNSIP